LTRTEETTPSRPKVARSVFTSTQISDSYDEPLAEKIPTTSTGR